MKGGGRAVFILGGVMAAIMVLWGAVGFYASQLPVMLVLGGSGIALMAVGSKMNKDKEPNKAVQWQPSSPPASAPLQLQHPSPPQAAVATSADFEPWALVGRNGVQYPLASTTLVGRGPSGPSYGITLTDADSSVSKVHAIVTIAGDIVGVRDAGSTNGTYFVTAEGLEVECKLHEDTVMSAGSTLELGNYALVLLAMPPTEEQ